MSNNLEIKSMIQYAKKIEATDIHLIAGSKIAFRVNNKLVCQDEYSSEVMKPQLLEDFVKLIVDDRQFLILQEQKHLVLAHSLESIGRFRMAISIQRGSYNFVIKIVQTSLNHVHRMDFHPVIEQVSQMKDGLVIISGGVKSGKSTSVAKILGDVNQNFQRSIVTVENPIEYLFKHDVSFVKQKEVGLDVNNHYDGLKSTLREDPDVIYIDQVSDLSTLELILNASEQGHLIIVAMYYTDILSTIQNILEAFPTEKRNRIRMQLAKVLKTIICQQLIVDETTGIKYPAFEVLLNNSAVKRLIIENKIDQIPQAMNSYREMGMISMEESLKILVENNKIHKDLAYHHATNPKRFLEWLVRK